MELAKDWAANHIAVLLTGADVTFTAVGRSMKYVIPHGSSVTIRPFTIDTPLIIGMIVLCQLDCGRQCLHQIGRIDGDRLLIQSCMGKVDGWIKRDSIFGYCIGYEPPTSDTTEFT